MALRSREDVRLCQECIGSLASQVGVTSAPTLPVVNMDEAATFYERAGFDVRIYRDENGDQGEGFAFIEFDEQSVFDLHVVDIDPARNGAGCDLVVHDVDGWHSRMSGNGLPVTPVEDQPWGMREFTLRDPSNNNVRIGQPAD